MSRRSYVTPVSEQDMRIRRAFKVGEAAWLLGLSYDVTLGLVRDGEIGAKQVGKYHVIPAQEIDRFLAPAIQDGGKPARRSR